LSEGFVLVNPLKSRIVEFWDKIDRFWPVVVAAGFCPTPAIRGRRGERQFRVDFVEKQRFARAESQVPLRAQMPFLSGRAHNQRAGSCEHLEFLVHLCYDNFHHIQLL